MLYSNLLNFDGSCKESKSNQCLKRQMLALSLLFLQESVSHNPIGGNYLSVAGLISHTSGAASTSALIYMKEDGT